MTRHSSFTACLALLLLGAISLTPAARAAETPSALAIDSARILIVRLDRATFTPDPANAARGGTLGKLRLQFTVTQALKGPPTPAVIEQNTYPSGAAGFHPGERLLLCLDERSDDDILGGPHEFNLVKDLTGQLTLPFDTPVCTEDLHPLPTPDLLAALRAELARPHPSTHTVDTPYHPEFERQPGAPTSIQLADDERLPGIVDRWLAAPNPVCRAFAVDLLAKHDLPGRMEKLRRALNDPWAADFTAHTSPWQARYYPIRDAAIGALRDLGVPRQDLEDVVATAPNTQYARVPFAWPLALFPLAGVAAYLWLRRRKVGRPAAGFRSLGVMSLLAAILVGALWLRGRWVADDFITVHPPVLVSLTSFGGGVQLLLATDAVVQLPLMHTAMTPDAGGTDFIMPSDRIFWHEFGSVFSFSGGHFQGVREARFDKLDEWEDPARPLDTNTMEEFHFHDLRRWIVPYRDILPLTLLLPLTCAGQLAWVGRRTRRRRRTGLCLACGYDLRTQSSLASPRCPECGTSAI